MSLLSSHRVGDLHIDDEGAMRHIGVYHQLVDALKADRVEFLVPPGGPLSNIDASALLNLAFWTPRGAAEVLPDPNISADQLAHNGWHHVGQRALGPQADTTKGLLLVESIASAFDIYLVGRLLGHSPDALFLQTQVPAMHERAADAGLSDVDFETLLELAAADPDTAFERLRRLLYDTSVALTECDDMMGAVKILSSFEDPSYGPLLHHYELPSWVLFAKAYAKPGPHNAVDQIDAGLRAAAAPVDWLADQWL